MTVFTRPELGDRKPQHNPEPVGPPEPMSVRLANALVTQAPMTMTQLDTVRLFYEHLAAMLLAAGPTFSPTRAQAVILHNTAVRRINGWRDDIRRRAREEEEAKLLEIER
jgi:hypothetical protein